MQEYFDNMHEAIKEFDKYNKENTMPKNEHYTYYSHPDMHQYPRKLKPLFMLIKVEVDPEIVYNTPKAHTYAQNLCDKFEYELVDYHYPSEYNGEFLNPFIKL